ncbi:unnamed protein product [Pleuronectes platessa]|uniref:Uncharacterized protein n=1 Tax=Pleuronectes platessa TaxID=8262 RepID=A0A9N7YYP2_PLEPL|nr:unnamed protein product [Pleuronectes platessa]
MPELLFLVWQKTPAVDRACKGPNQGTNTPVFVPWFGVVFDDFAHIFIIPLSLTLNRKGLQTKHEAAEWTKEAGVQSRAGGELSRILLVSTEAVRAIKAACACASAASWRGLCLQPEQSAPHITEPTRRHTRRSHE